MVTVAEQATDAAAPVYAPPPAAPADQPRPRRARGQDRPVYLDSPDLDRVVIMLIGLMSEVSALRDRLDTHEALGEAGTVATTAAVESYELDEARQAVREQRRDAMLGRALRVLYEDLELQDGD